MGNAQMIEVLKVKLQETKEKMRSIEREIQALGIQMNPDDFEDYSKAIVFKEDEVSKMYKEFFKQI
jgi:hypothetical protein